MWLLSFLDSSYDRAVWWNDAANFVLLVSLVLGLLATFVIVRTSSIKEEHLKHQLEEARRETAASLARAAIAEQRAAEANLELARYRAQRKLTPEQHKDFVAKLGEFSGTAFDIAGSTNEALIFALSIESALTEAGWNFKSWTAGGLSIVLPYRRPFLAGSVLTTGVDIRILDPHLLTARDALVNLLLQAGFDGIVGTEDKTSPDDPNRIVIHIMVGPRP